MRKETSLVPSQGGDVYAIMDQLDEEQIQAAIENRITETWVYTFKADGRPQTGLSKVGVDACCTEMAKGGHVIREGEPQMSLDPTNPEYVLFSCPASRFEINAQDGRETLYDIVTGVKRQWTKMRLRDRRVVDDPFWFEKGAMKAARNARSRLIPEEYKNDIIKLARKEKKKDRVHAIVTEVSDPKKMSDEQRNHLWTLARTAVDDDEKKAQANVKKLLKVAGVQATVELTLADYDKICNFLEHGEIPKEWEGKLGPEPSPKEEAPF